MRLQSRLDSEMLRLNDLLDAGPVERINTDNIAKESLHEALLYLSDRSTRPSSQQKNHEKKRCRCIADVLLLLDGVDIKKVVQKSPFEQAIE